MKNLKYNNRIKIHYKSNKKLKNSPILFLKNIEKIKLFK